MSSHGRHPGQADIRAGTDIPALQLLGFVSNFCKADFLKRLLLFNKAEMLTLDELQFYHAIAVSSMRPVRVKAAQMVGGKPQSP